MKLNADYHTHSRYSHGKGSVLENALFAKKLGLKEIGISDHGFSHPAFGLRKKDLNDLIKDCKEAGKETGVRVLVGIESNFTSVDGKVDLKPSLYDKFDLFLAGLHKFVKVDFKTFFTLSAPDIILSKFKAKRVSTSLKKTNTKAYVNAIKNNPIDVITHLNYCAFADAVEVAKVAADYGTYLELNAKKIHLTDEEICGILKTGVRFVIGSDAHCPNRVGEISLVLNQLERTGFPIDRIDNVDGRLPKFRFREFKEKRL